MFILIIGALFCIINLIIVFMPHLTTEERELYKSFFFIGLIPTIASLFFFIEKWIKRKKKS
jgi:hypothetical protein